MAANPELEPKPDQTHEKQPQFETETESDEQEDQWWEEGAEDGGSEEAEPRLFCLFCHLEYFSCGELFEHCHSAHCFDFAGLRRELGLGFYACFKLINYVRSQVACNRCWSCQLEFKSNEELVNHLHKTLHVKGIRHLWDDDKYLQPYMEDDSLLFSFDVDEDGDEDFIAPVHLEDVVMELDADANIDMEIDIGASSSNGNVSSGAADIGPINGAVTTEHTEASDVKQRDNNSSSLLNLAAKEVKKVNEDYFGSYSSFGIHREMLSDKVRMDAYREAILRNSSLITGAVVMDVGCGTGVLSLFAAQAGASRVIAVEASEKMAAVATQIAKDNGHLRVNATNKANGCNDQVVEVVQGMVEELDKTLHIEPGSIDVLLSEWMGYCLLYESMLSSVLYARDKWLKPGGAILPDIATMYAAGFGKGNTSLPFWEDVYGFNMSSVGKELLQDAAKFPIVDMVDDRDLVTQAVVLQTFDLTSMKPEEVDFTASIELEPKSYTRENDSSAPMPKTSSCYGVVLWFDTSFTERFCRESPAVLSTSPCGPKTHWSQTIFTFTEPIAMAAEELSFNKSAAVGTDLCPAARLHLRISVARAAQHRCIDISVETAAICFDGRRRSWPAQMFNLS